MFHFVFMLRPPSLIWEENFVWKKSTMTTTTTTEKQVLSNNIVLTDSLLLTQASSEKILETSLGICKHKMRKVNLKSQNQMHTEGYLNIRDKESKKKQKKQQKKLDYAYCFDMCMMTVGKEQCPMPNFWSTISLIFSQLNLTAFFQS